MVLEDFPVPNIRFLDFSLSNDGKLADKPPTASQSLTYDSEDRKDCTESHIPSPSPRG